MYHVYDEMRNSLRQQRKLLQSFKKDLEILPKGGLMSKTQNEKTYYYRVQRIDGEQKRTFLRSKRDEKLIWQLKRRRFIAASIPAIKKNISALEKALKTYQPYDPGVVCETLSLSYKDAISDKRLWLPSELDLQRWAAEVYDQYQGRPESLIHETATGLMVRSKSEAMIADRLAMMKIPFRYEQNIVANGKSYAPDFVILHPVLRRLTYWEHFGRMDDPEYVVANSVKIMDYRQAGIRAGDNFIMTFENQKCPLTIREIQDTIELHLL